MTIISFNASECMMKKLGFKAERKTHILQNVLRQVPLPLEEQLNWNDC